MGTLRRHGYGPSDEGSLLLFLLVFLVVGALTGITLATAISTQTKARNNQNFTTALPPADANVQTSLELLNAAESANIPTTPKDSAGNPVSTDSTTGCPTSSSWYGTKVDPLTWKVWSTKVVNGVLRCVHVTEKQSPRFPVAAFGVSQITFRGGNTANSYNHTSGQSNTGNGFVGTDGDVIYLGNASSNGTQLYNWQANPVSTRCTQQSGAGGTCTNVTDINNNLDITSSSATAFMTNAEASLCGASPPAWVASQHNYTLTPGTYCYSSLYFDGDTTVSGAAAGLCDGSQTGDVIIYVTGNVTGTDHININFDPSTPWATNACALQIYSTGSSVAFGNHTSFGGSIYAPFGNCGGNPSNAQADIYGSAVCGTIGNQGGWSFHYDDALTNIGNGYWATGHYDEN